jgi:hypothetical protein
MVNVSHAPYMTTSSPRSRVEHIWSVCNCARAGESHTVCSTTAYSHLSKLHLDMYSIPLTQPQTTSALFAMQSRVARRMAKKAIDDDINTFIHSIYNDITEQRTSVEHHIPNLKANIDTMRSSPGYSTSHETQPTGMLMQVKGLPRLCKNYYFDLEELESIFERD